MLGISPANPDDATLRRILSDYKEIVVVGLSPKPERDSNRVARYLLAAGYRLIPVNPAVDQVLGLASYPSLSAVPGPLSLVDVFRRSEAVPELAREARQLGAKVLWLQEGVRHDQAALEAAQAGLIVVQDSCIMVEHARLLG